MKIHESITVRAVIFIVAFAPMRATASDDDFDIIHSKSCCCRDEYRTCLELRAKLQGKECPQAPFRDAEGHPEQNCGCELLEEIEKNEGNCRKDQDQQSELLEKLILDSAVSGINSPFP